MTALSLPEPRLMAKSANRGNRAICSQLARRCSKGCALLDRDRVAQEHSRRQGSLVLRKAERAAVDFPKPPLPVISTALPSRPTAAACTSWQPLVSGPPVKQAAQWSCCCPVRQYGSCLRPINSRCCYNIEKVERILGPQIGAFVSSASHRPDVTAICEAPVRTWGRQHIYAGRFAIPDVEHRVRAGVGGTVRCASAGIKLRASVSPANSSSAPSRLVR